MEIIEEEGIPGQGLKFIYLVELPHEEINPRRAAIRFFNELGYETMPTEDGFKGKLGDKLTAYIQGKDERPYAEFFAKFKTCKCYLHYKVYTAGKLLEGEEGKIWEKEAQNLEDYIKGGKVLFKEPANKKWYKISKARLILIGVTAFSLSALAIIISLAFSNMLVWRGDEVSGQKKRKPPEIHLKKAFKSLKNKLKKQ
ncbi:hypothetical protein ACFL6Y_03205 [Elusimicrobiota bacterium]